MDTDPPHRAVVPGRAWRREEGPASAADAFAATARAQAETVGTVVSLRRVQTGDVQTGPLGFSYVVVSYEVRRSVGGVVGTTSDNVYFLFENSAWRLWFSVTQ